MNDNTAVSSVTAPENGAAFGTDNSDKPIMSCPVYRILQDEHFYTLAAVRRVQFPEHTSKPDNVQVQMLFADFTLAGLREHIANFNEALLHESVSFFGEKGISEDEAERRKQLLLSSLTDRVRFDIEPEENEIDEPLELGTL